jgi:hypothetical protein
VYHYEEHDWREFFLFSLLCATHLRSVIRKRSREKKQPGKQMNEKEQKNESSRMNAREDNRFGGGGGAYNSFLCHKFHMKHIRD